MPFLNRFTTTVPGAVTFTGNTLGLSPISPAPGNIFGTLAVFTTVNTALQVPGFPAGTTDDWRLNSSSAILNLPAGSSILYAELVWAGTFRTDTEDVLPFLNDNITFTTPAGTFSVTPDPATAQQGSVGNQFYYARSANVTNLVSAGGAGTYTTGAVPATRTSADPTISRSAGWTLEVVYQNASLPLRNLSVYAGQEIIDASSPPVDATISGFATPATGAVTGRVLVTAQEGDSNISGDQLRFGPNANTTVALFGPRNPANNFFQSQICNDSGNLDTSGTFGDLNQPLGVALAVRRQGWDITNVDASSSLVNNQTSATVRFVTNGDGYAAAGFGVQIDATGPIINPVKSVNRTVAGVGDTLTYTITVPNTGTGSAENVVLRDSIPNGTTFVAGSVTVGGVTQPNANPATGINLGTIPNNTQRIVTFQVRITSFPNPNPIPNRAMVSYQFRPFVGSPLITSMSSSNTVQTTVNQATISMQKSVDLQTATLNDVLTYTVNVTNNGNVTANNVIFVDSIPAGTTFVANSVIVNGVARPGANPASSINLGSINASQTTVVRFQVRVTSNPLVNPIPNRASATFTFTPVPGQQPVSGQATSNTVVTTINIADIRTRKIVDRAFATVNDVLTYTVTIENTGNVLATNVVFQDPIPIGTTFITNSVTVDGVSQPGANPATGFTVANISPGGSRTVTFQVRVTSTPSGGTIPNRGNVTANFVVIPNQPPITINRQTNTVVTQVNTGGLNVIKEVNTTQAVVGDTLTYTIAVQNTGNVPLTNVFFQDAISSAVSFVANSVTINGVPQSGLNPNTGFSLPNIPAAQTVVVTFDVLIIQDPENEDILNQANVTASFQVNPSEPPVTINVPSNIVNTTVQSGNFEVVKSVNTDVATVGDVLVYTIEIINAGSVPATNVFFQDSIPQGTLFIENSVFVNGVLQEGADPELGFPLNDLPTGASVIVTFEVLIDEIPLGNNVVNSANVTGDFLVNPTEPPITVTEPSNTVMTVVNSSGLNVIKSVSATEAGVGDTLTYTVRIQNSGTVAATNVSFLDPIPSGTTFVANSVIINGTPQPGLNPTTGFPLANIPVGGMVTVAFQVTITSVPPNRVLPNNANVTADFQVSPLQPPITIVTISNIVVTRVNVGSLNVMKSVNTLQAGVGDTLTYTILIQNTGTVPATNIIFQDPIPSGTAFVANSVTINGVVQQGADPMAGFPVPNIPVGQTATVTFQVTVTSIPSGGNIRNQSNITASFLINPANPPITTVTNSNFVVTQVNTAQLNIQKTSSVQQAALGETYTYSVVIRNNGTVTATNVSFIDPIAPETTFVANSVTINGTPQPGFDPNVGFPLPNIAAGTSLTVTFQVTVIAPSTRGAVLNTASAIATFLLNPLQPPVTTTNSSNTTVVTIPLPPPGEVTATKTVDVAAGAVGDVLTYTVLISNVGIIPVTDVFFQDVIPEGTTFVEGSVTIGGVQQLGLNPEIGFTVTPLLIAGGSIEITFQVTITEIPDNEVILNDADVTFTSQPNPQEPPITETILTNLVVTTINIAFVFPLKLVDKEVATVGEILTYDVLIFNFGTVPATNVQYSDVLPSSIAFEPNSVTIDGVLQPGFNPNNGFPLPDINPGESVEVTFQVTVVSVPSNGTIVNTANVTGSFVLVPGEPPVIVTGPSNTTLTTVNRGQFNVIKQVNRAATLVGDVLTYTVQITNTGTVTANDVQFIDTISAGASFVPNSVTINGALQPNLNPITGFGVGDIPVGETVVVTFQATVTNIPASGTITNVANITGSCTLVPGEPPVVVTEPSNTTITSINRGRFSVIKSVNKEATRLGDTLTYSVQVTNTGTVTATNVQFIDVPSPSLEFVPGSVQINGIPQVGLNPFIGFSLPDLAVGDSVLITFAVNVIAVPPSSSIMNTARVTGDFELIPGEPPFTITNSSNTTVTPVNRGSLDMQKEVDNSIVGVGETVTYTVRILNTGTADAMNVQFIDVLSPEAVFVPNSVTVNGVARPGVNPQVGFTIVDIPVGETAIVTYEATITSFPDGGTVVNVAGALAEYILVPGEPPVTVMDTSNTVIVTVNTAILFVAKGANFEVAMVGDVVTYGIAVINDSTVPVTNIVLTDIIDPNTLFINGTVTVNDVALPFANPNTGIPLGDFQPNDAAIINFQVVITGGQINNLVTNTAIANGLAIVNPNELPVVVEGDSNTVVIPFIPQNVSTTVVKTADLQAATIGDVIIFTTVITNTGDTVIQNIRFQDMLDSSVRFVLGSVTVDNTPVPNVSPVSGFLIGNLNPGEARTVSFQVVVQSAPNGSGNYINQASIRFEHQVGTVLPPVTQIVESNIVVIPFVPTIEQICETNLNCLGKIPFQCSPCDHLQIKRK
ncbi:MULTISPECIES: DUF11 domain-containing protein [Bacillus]|uniref:DUF11 domain-containing protein n=4 Tax=Bacillus anthracis TaxID=1392 RepID=A0A640LYY7_BACAN|nr:MULTISPECIES: DUF11 domain-containing protein [Bacillus]EJT20847.1 hypothetical protein B353_10229 [Bacillus anthracis str. UR-1]EXJ19260.1 Reticulocyte binding protein [Bacillus anthracis str. 95014]AAT55648.1 conserved repeat domain protein [Bacillus anthracis str. Sterne]ACP14176.1 conserved repeat domain protein [Bacillus anthracis str. CDC 684]AHE84995.2 hypothetical protein A16R_36540 [Bacillus anthracis str. A16R]